MTRNHFDSRFRHTQRRRNRFAHRFIRLTTIGRGRYPHAYSLNPVFKDFTAHNFVTPRAGRDANGNGYV